MAQILSSAGFFLFFSSDLFFEDLPEMRKTFQAQIESQTKGGPGGTSSRFNSNRLLLL